MDNKVIIELNNLTKIYKKNKSNISVLNDINLEFKESTFYVITGESGSGKSTLINIIGTMDKEYDGEYKIYNQNILKLNDHELSKIRMEKIGFIFQDFKLNKNLTALENIMLPMLINDKISKEDRLSSSEKLLNRVGLIDRKNHFPKELSGGEQQRVAIARSLANSPKIILADEPTGNLDEKNEMQIFKLLKELTKEGYSVIVVSHSRKIKKYADKIFNIRDGKLIEEKNENN